MHCGGDQGCQKVRGLCLVSPGALSALFSFTTCAHAHILPSSCPTPTGSSLLKGYVEVFGVCLVDEPLSAASHYEKSYIPVLSFQVECSPVISCYCFLTKGQHFSELKKITV